METKIRIHVFGNRELGFDSLPLRLLPRLRKEFLGIDFIELDPNEDWEIPDPFRIIDTVQGLPDVHIFHGLSEFESAPTVSVHDFDALFNLRYLQKLGKIGTTEIVGVPPSMDENAALPKVRAALRELLRD